MKNIAIVCGGYSGEFEISMKSGKVVEKHLDSDKYKAFLIVIEQAGWYHPGKDGKRHPVNRNDFSLEVDGQKVVFDGVFNAIHGTPGEDGILQAYFDLLDLPYTSCGSATSSLTFNKYFCNRFVAASGVRVADSVSLNRNDRLDAEAVAEQLGLPLFVKPACSGSSVGISKVNRVEELPAAVEKAFREDDRILIEAFMAGREIACGMIEKQGELLVFPLTEIISGNEFFDYEAKYTAGKAREITPADVPEEAELDIKTTSSYLYRQLDCKGFVRFDYILAEDGLYFLEVNTIPGMTEASLLPQQAEAFGMSIGELFSIAVEDMFGN